MKKVLIVLGIVTAVAAGTFGAFESASDIHVFSEVASDIHVWSMEA